MDSLFLALRVILSLAVVLGLLWMLQRKLGRGAGVAGSAKLMTVVTRQVISPKASVVMLDVEGTRFLLGVTEQSVTVINTALAPVAAPEAVATNSGADFAQVMVETGATGGANDPIRLRPRRAPGALDGSLLSGETWKRTAAAFRQAR
ncbi:MAG: fliO [Homoserinimonas sp.]|nr:fliO [Homoserinimonas sp.]